MAVLQRIRGQDGVTELMSGPSEESWLIQSCGGFNGGAEVRMECRGRWWCLIGLEVLTVGAATELR